MKKNKVITDIEQVTPEWLTSIFKNNGYLSHGKVTKIISSNSEKVTSSEIHFLELAFSEDAQTEGISSKIVIKTPISRSVSGMDQHEVKFYNLIARSLNPMLIPICYDATISEETGQSHTIFENVLETHYEYELSGWPVPPLKRDCEKAIDCLAEIHASWWDHKKLKELSKYAYILTNYEENSFNEKEISNWSKERNKVLKRFLIFLGERISNKRKELIKTVFSLYPQLAFERIKKGNITIIHNDASTWNFFYPKDSENEKAKAILSDWQLWALGVGPTDLAFMIGMYWYPERRNLMEKDLVKRYHANLIKFGVENYSWDECWYDYKLSTLLNLYKVISYWYWNALPFLWWYALERAFLTIEDLNCMELLESINKNKSGGVEK